VVGISVVLVVLVLLGISVVVLFRVVVVVILEAVVADVGLDIVDVVAVVDSISPRARIKAKLSPATREAKIYFPYFRNH
jgi:hypothetical protein